MGNEGANPFGFVFIQNTALPWFPEKRALVDSMIVMDKKQMVWRLISECGNGLPIWQTLLLLRL